MNRLSLQLDKIIIVNIMIIIALNDVLGANDEFQSMVATRVLELQAQRRTATPKVSATPESVINAVKQGKISLDELKAQIKLLES